MDSGGPGGPMADKILKIQFDDELPAVFPTHLVAQHDAHEFTLNFFRISSPLLVGSDEDKAARLAELDKVKARGLVRVIVPASRMAEFMKVLEQNYRTYMETVDEPETEARK